MFATTPSAAAPAGGSPDWLDRQVARETHERVDEISKRTPVATPASADAGTRRHAFPSAQRHRYARDGQEVTGEDEDDSNVFESSARNLFANLAAPPPSFAGATRARRGGAAAAGAGLAGSRFAPIGGGGLSLQDLIAGKNGAEPGRTEGRAEVFSPSPAKRGEERRAGAAGAAGAAAKKQKRRLVASDDSETDSDDAPSPLDKLAVAAEAAPEGAGAGPRAGRPGRARNSGGASPRVGRPARVGDSDSDDDGNKIGAVRAGVTKKTRGRPRSAPGGSGRISGEAAKLLEHAARLVGGGWRGRGSRRASAVAVRDEDGQSGDDSGEGEGRPAATPAAAFVAGRSSFGRQRRPPSAYWLGSGAGADVDAPGSRSRGSARNPEPRTVRRTAASASKPTPARRRAPAAKTPASAAREPAREARGFRAVSDVPASDTSDDSNDSDDSSSSGDDDEDDSSGSGDSSSGESDSEVSGSGSESVSDPPHAKVLLRAPAAYDSDSFEHDGGSVPGLGGDEDESDGGHGGGEASDDSLRSLRSGNTSGDEEEALGDAGANGERRTAEALPKARETRPAPSPRVFGRKAPASRGADGSKASSARTSAADRNPASTSNEAKAKGKASPAKASPAATKKKRASRAAAADAAPAKRPKSAEAKTLKDPDAPKGKRGGFRPNAGRPKGALGKKNRERVEQGLEPELASLKKPKKPKRPKTQAEAAREAKGAEGTMSAADRAAAVKALAKKGPIVKRAAAEAAAAAKAAADAAAAEAAAKATPPPKVRPWNRKPIAAGATTVSTVSALALTPSPSPRRNKSSPDSAALASAPSGSGDPWTTRKLDGAVARQRERERRWEKPLDVDAGYDDDFAIFEFGDGTPDATPTKVQNRLAKVVDMATTGG